MDELPGASQPRKRLNLTRVNANTPGAVGIPRRVYEELLVQQAFADVYGESWVALALYGNAGTAQ